MFSNDVQTSLVKIDGGLPMTCMSDRPLPSVMGTPMTRLSGGPDSPEFIMVDCLLEWFNFFGSWRFHRVNRTLFFCYQILNILCRCKIL
uniref:Uncharacterized protein n=1 Tax=Arundo donax TaxID=35708 RepID=A0A0A9EA82_ARUDO